MWHSQWGRIFTGMKGASGCHWTAVTKIEHFEPSQPPQKKKRIKKEGEANSDLWGGEHLICLFIHLPLFILVAFCLAGP